ncbi:MAG: hypothetical protein WBK88_00050 [Methanothrix sp.]
MNTRSELRKAAGVNWPHVSPEDVSRLSKSHPDAIRSLLETVKDDSKILIPEERSKDGKTLISAAKEMPNPMPTYARLGFKSYEELLEAAKLEAVEIIALKK